MTESFQSALAAHRAGRLAEAEAGYRLVLRRNPNHADALHLLGLLHLQRRDFGAAERLIGDALRRREDVNFLNNLSIVLQKTNRLPDAEAAYRRALVLAPRHADIRVNLGNLLRQQGRPDEAEAECRLALGSSPDHAGAQNLLGLVLLETGRPGEADLVLRRAIAVQPAHVDAHVNLGVVQEKHGRLVEAEALLRRALALDPGHAGALTNLGVLLRKTNRLAEAEPLLRRALDAGHAGAEVSLGYVLLGLGRYEDGWRHYEARLAPDQPAAAETRPDLPCPPWRGESLTGHSLVIWPEQGFGDVIQFIRYAPLLRARGLARLTLVCAPPLAALMTSAAGIDAVVTDPDTLAPHDYWCLIASLPLRLGPPFTTVPAPIPYLHAAPALVDLWRSRLPDGGLKVGLAWKGSATHTNDADRSLPGISIFEPLWSVPGVTFVSLQKGQGEDEARAWAGRRPILDLGPAMRDFADAAAIVSQLDLVICVDTALAHLAGALGIPCWVLLPAFGLDWRWLQDRDESPWYPGRMRLFRQTVRGAWGETVGQVAEALGGWG